MLFICFCLFKHRTKGFLFSSICWKNESKISLNHYLLLCILLHFNICLSLRFFYYNGMILWKIKKITRNLHICLCEYVSGLFIYHYMLYMCIHLFFLLFLKHNQNIPETTQQSTEVFLLNISVFFFSFFHICNM